MFFIISFLIFIIYTAFLLRRRQLRWIGWALSALYFLIIVLFGSALQAVFNIEQSSQTFFMFLAFVYSLTPLVAGEIVDHFMKRKQHV